MLIQKDKEWETFRRHCLHNISSDRKNSFLGLPVSKDTEKDIQRQMKQAGFAEFANEPYPSLFLSTEQWLSSPYHKHIDLTRVQYGSFRYEKQWYAGNELFNADAIQKDPDRELNDWMKLRAMDNDFPAVCLYQNEKSWMLDSPSEAATNDPCAAKARGHTVTFGLGIGYFLYMCTLNPAVKEITVIERSPEVIDLFETCILPQFHTSVPLHLIAGDAYAYWNEDFLKDKDYIYADIWQSSDDGLASIAELLEQYRPETERADFWIEDSCEEIMWTLSFLYFDACMGNRHKIAPQYNRYMKKIRSWYQKTDPEIHCVSDMKHYMYDRSTIRSILSLRV